MPIVSEVINLGSTDKNSSGAPLPQVASRLGLQPLGEKKYKYAKSLVRKRYHAHLGHLCQPDIPSMLLKPLVFPKKGTRHCGRYHQR